MIEEQTCRKCNTIKSISEFGKDKTMKFGYKIYCKQCRKIESLSYFERFNSKIKDYYNKPEIKERVSIWGVKYRNKPEVQKRLKLYRQSENNKKIQHNYRLKYKEHLLTKTRMRQVLKKALLHPEHDQKVEMAMYKECKFLSYETGYKWQVDHIYPLNEGGPHWHLNLQVIPASINRDKGTKLDYRHDWIKHWSDLPSEVLDWISKIPKGFVDIERDPAILKL